MPAKVVYSYHIGDSRLNLGIIGILEFRGGKQGRMAHKNGGKTDKQDRVLGEDKQGGTADTLWRVQTNEQSVDSQQGTRSDDQQDHGVAERRAETEDDRPNGTVDKQDDPVSEMTDVTNEKQEVTADVDVHEKNGMPHKQGVIIHTQSTGTNTPDPITQLGIMIRRVNQDADGQSCEAKDSSGSGAGAAQKSGLEIDCSRPLSEALQNIVSNGYSIILTLPPSSSLISQVSI